MTRPMRPTSPQTSWKTVARVLVGAAIFAAGIVGAVGHRHVLDQAFRLMGRARPGWVLTAVAAEVVSLALFARLQRWLLRCGGVVIRWTEMIEITLAGNAMALTLPGGAAFAAAWSFRQLRRRGADRMLSAWVVLMAGALSSFALFLVLAGGAVVAGGHGPVASLRWLAVALASIPATAAVLVVAARWVPAVRQVTDRLTRGERLTKFRARVGLVHPSAAGWVEAFALAACNWIADLACLIAAISAVHGHVPWSGILVAYGLGRLAASLPLTPGGLAVVEGSLSALLIAYGMTDGSAIAAVLLYRAISFWALVPVGWIMYGVVAASHPDDAANRSSGAQSAAPA